MSTASFAPALPRDPFAAAWTRWRPFLGILATATVFDRLFWTMDLGLNLTLFAVWVAVFVLLRLGWKGLSVPARMAFVATLVAAVMVYVHHSIVAILAAMVALCVFAAFAHEQQLRSILYAVPQFVGAFGLTPVNAWERFGDLWPEDRNRSSGWRWVRLAMLPLLIGVLFFQLYRAGNPKFDELTAGFLSGLTDLLAELFTPHAFFFGFGLLVAGALLRRQAPRLMSHGEQRWTDALLRQRVRRPHWMSPLAMDPLERERRAGILFLVLVNAMLLVVNAIDISWVWIGFEVEEGISLKQFVHNGTWMLIISILLSIVILLHLFRGNQNFYGRSGSLKKLAVLWIAQNFILGISVFLRNYHYISFHGLAYKRIGVIVFLALVLVGLITLYVKVWKRKSFFHVVRVNTWAWFLVLIGLSTVDWDSFIVRHNLRHDNPGEIDIDNYLAMSDKVLPLLYANLDVVEAQMEKHRSNNVRWVYHLDPYQFRQELDSKRIRFLHRVAGRHWQERNAADDRTMHRLLALNATTSTSN